MQMPTETEDNNTKSMSDADELEQNTTETMQLQDIPTHILVCLKTNVNIRKKFLYFRPEFSCIWITGSEFALSQFLPHGAH
jgi:hypothetical protein